MGCEGFGMLVEKRNDFQLKIVAGYALRMNIEKNFFCDKSIDEKFVLNFRQRQPYARNLKSIGR